MPSQFRSVQSLTHVRLLQPHGLWNIRLPCPSPTSGAHANSCPSRWWCHPSISYTVILFSSCLQSFPAWGSFPVSQFFASGGLSIGISASAWVLPKNIQDWFPLRWTGWISLQSKGLSRIFSNATVQKHQFFDAQLSWVQLSHPYRTTGKNIILARWTFISKVMSLLFNILSRFTGSQSFTCIGITREFLLYISNYTWNEIYSEQNFKCAIPYMVDSRLYNVVQQIFRVYMFYWTETLYVLISNSHFCSPTNSQKLPFYSLLSMTFLPLDTSCKWSHAVFVLLQLAYFTEHNSLKFQSWCCMLQDFLLFKNWMVFHGMYMPHFLDPFICSWAFRLFPHLGCYA